MNKNKYNKLLTETIFIERELQNSIYNASEVDDEIGGQLAILYDKIRTINKNIVGKIYG